MAHDTRYSCPRCDYPIRRAFAGGDVFASPECRGRFRFLLDEQTGHAAMVDQDDRPPCHPLFLPRGSVRALVSLALAASFWVLTFTGRAVPGYLMNLLLTVVGYYFGYRADADQGDVRVYDASAEVERPLALPSGVIRLVLVAGFAASGVALLAAGKLMELAYVEFFVILSGLLLGALFGKMLSKIRGSGAYMAVNHVKAVLVLGLAGLLTWILVGGRDADMSERLMVVLCSAVSFYFGSRS